MLTDNFQKFCDCFYAPIYPPSPITSIGNEGRKALGKNAFLSPRIYTCDLIKQCNLITKFI